MGASRVAKHLWMGSKPIRGGTLARQGFNVLVLCAMEEQPDARNFPGLDRVIYIPLDDDPDGPPVSREDAKRAHRAAREVAGLVLSGKRCLVTCQMGLNRSGLVTVLSMMKLGFAAPEAIAIVRDARAGDPITHKYGRALYNPHFLDIVRRYNPSPASAVAELR